MSSRNVPIDRVDFREVRIPFKVAFRHAAAERVETETIWIDAVSSDGTAGSGESCPRSYVTGETLASARAFIAANEAQVRHDVTSVAALIAWVAGHRPAIDENPAAWCALELAILDLFGRLQGVAVETLLSMPMLSGVFRYSAVLGDSSPSAFHATAERYRRLGFSDFKVKLSGDAERDRDKFAIFRTWPSRPLRVRADANNVWPHAKEAIASLRVLDYPFFAIEEPISRGRYSELSDVSRALNCPVILDESCVSREQVLALPEPRSQWLLNVRVSKMGGLIRSIHVIEAARQRGIGVIVGSQVGETSVLTRAALTAAQAAGDALVAQEGAFGTFLLERDVADPPLMFSAGGLLDIAAYPSLTGPGFGLSIARTGVNQ